MIKRIALMISRCNKPSILGKKEKKSLDVLNFPRRFGIFQ